MPQLFYHLKNLPTGLHDAGHEQCFRAGRAGWTQLGLWPVVDRVNGNGVLHPLDNGRMRLAVWPADHEFTPPTGTEHLLEVDDELQVSWFGDTPPRPADLDNDNPLRLRTVPMILADGEVWEVPEIREPSGSLLPTDLTRDRKTGRLLNPIKREYLQLWEESEYWFGLKWAQISGEATSFVLERALVFATQILGLRYRFCDATQTALRIIDSVNVQEVIEAAIGWPATLERIKEIYAEEDAQKKRSVLSVASVNGSCGLEASDPTTSQHEVNNG